MATLSLYLFNLLPLPHTDGIQLFSALVSARRRGQANSSSNGSGRQLSGQMRSQHPTINPYRYDGYDSDDSDHGNGIEPSWAAGYGRREEIWQRRLRRFVEGGTAAVVAGWALGWMMLALLRSS
jgi:S2P endopeptidase